MKQKNILILVIIAVIVVGAVWFFMIREPVDPDPVVPNDLVDPIVKEEIPLELELCRRAITIAQLREIFDYKGYFTFTEKELPRPEIGNVKTCGIVLSRVALPDIKEIKDLPEELEQKIEKMIGIEFFPLGITHERIEEVSMESFGMMAWMWEGKFREEVEGIERAFSIEIPPEIPALGYRAYMHIIFLEPDTNQTIGVLIKGAREKPLNYEAFVNLARQVEENLR